MESCNGEACNPINYNSLGRRVEHMKGLYIIGAIMAWAATAFGVWVGFTYYSWAYPFSSGDRG
jgi:hypothetical protein